ncbi:MAG: MBL fold metallo-hydrolase [Syntrophales bacterium]|nr:MBL fold metallo-hydrolase [Syntrophales bacterium]
MKVTVIGCGDAFSTGGRFHSCFHLEGERINILIDCGASSLVSLKMRHVSLNDIQAIVISHFHADHAGGVPFFLLDAHYISRRKRPLTIAGPKGIMGWFERAMEASFPGSLRHHFHFELSLVELGPFETRDFGYFQVSSYLAEHGEPGGLAYAYRIMAEGKSVAYTGDTAWTDRLIDAAGEADLFIAEAYTYEPAGGFHLDVMTLIEKYALIKPRQMVLTHMGAEVLDRAFFLPFKPLDDGMVIEI